MEQIDLLFSSDWDVLIILDGCRYDYFESLHKHFLKGKLRKVTSPASCTETWLQCWDGKYDFTYVSGNPYVNSMGVPIRGYVEEDGTVTKGYTALNHFKKIIDVWNYGWDNKLDTVLPSTMNEAVLNQTNRTDLIIHYVQPHWPYIGETRLSVGTGKRLRANVQKGVYSKKRLKKEPPKKMGWTPQQIKQLRAGYTESLSIALKKVSKLIPHLKGKIVISADHGDLLGEGGLYWHPCFFEHPLLREIPWFEVKI